MSNQHLIFIACVVATFTLRSADPVPTGFYLRGATSFGSPHQVTLAFSKALDSKTIANPTQYTVDPDSTVLSVKYRTNAPRLITLSLSGPTHHVQVRDVRSIDQDLLQPESAVDVSEAPWMPLDTGLVVSGFQDSFADPLLDVNWVTYAPGAATDVPPPWVLTNGMMQAHSNAKNPSSLKIRHHLLLKQPGYDLVRQEILARVRWRGSLTDAGAGVESGVKPTNAAPSSVGEGVHWRNVAGRGGAGFGTTPLAPTDPRPLVLNQWHWMRLRHAPDVASGAPDVFAKIWLADGTEPEPEPEDWMTWDYWNGDNSTLRTGFAGVGGYLTSTVGRGFDVDYVLIKADGLPSIRVDPDGILPRIQGVGGNRVVPAGGTLELMARTDGGEGVTHQWRREGVTLEGQIGPRLILTNATAALAGLYDVLVSNSAGTVTSPAIRVEIVGEPLYHEAFVVGAGPEWSTQSVTISTNFSRPILGPIRGVSTLTLSNAPTEGLAFVSALVFPTGAWLGNNPQIGDNGLFRVSRDGTDVYTTSFSLASDARGTGELSRFKYSFQNYPSTIGGVTFPPMYGATEAMSWSKEAGGIGIGSGPFFAAYFPIDFLVPVKMGGNIVLEFQNLLGAQTPPIAPSQFFSLGNVSISTIGKNLSVMRFAQTAFAGNEAEGSLKFRVERIGNLQVRSSVRLEFEDESAFSGKDYIAVSRTIEFPVGSAEQDVLVPLIDDSVPNGSRRFIARLNQANPNAVLADRATAVGHIGDDDSGIRFKTNTLTVVESTPALTIGIEAFGFVGEPRWFNLATSGGTAAINADYTLPRPRYILAAGTTQLDVPMSILGDSDVEPTENAWIQIQRGPETRPAEPATLEAILLDDDQGLALEISLDSPGKIRIEFLASRGSVYRIETTENLVQWSTLQEMTASETKVAFLLDANNQNQFFRVLRM